jgi:hypothetical protein
MKFILVTKKTYGYMNIAISGTLISNLLICMYVCLTAKGRNVAINTMKIGIPTYLSAIISAKKRLLSHLS